MVIHQIEYDYVKNFRLKNNEILKSFESCNNYLSINEGSLYCNCHSSTPHNNLFKITLDIKFIFFMYRCVECITSPFYIKNLFYNF